VYCLPGVKSIAETVIVSPVQVNDIEPEVKMLART
jgi:hypothetical protein